MTSSFSQGFAYRLGKLFPQTSSLSKTLAESELVREVPKLTSMDAGAGVVILPRESYVWFRKPDGRYTLIVLARERSPFTDLERQLLAHCPDVIRTFVQASAGGSTAMSNMRLAARNTAMEVTVARLMRGSTGNVWTPGLVLGKLRELALTKYENNPCTSGFVYFSDSEEGTDTLGARGFSFQRLEAEDLYLSEQFFDYPASHRYVDGLGSFYLIDNEAKILGVLRCHRLRFFSTLETSTRRHVEHLLRDSGAGSWAAWVGANQDVTVMFPGGGLVRYQNQTWRVLEMVHLVRAMRTFGIEEGVAETTARLAFLIAEERMGTTVFFPRHRRISLSRVAGIDRTDLGRHLSQTITNLTIDELVKEGLALGVLTSDGITSVGLGGDVLKVGQIIEVSRNHDSEVVGGGRTQASIAASRHGLVLKVSEDGPVSIFEGGREMVKLFT